MKEPESLIPTTLDELISEFVEVEIQYPLRDERGRFIHQTHSWVKEPFFSFSKTAAGAAIPEIEDSESVS